MSLHSVQRRTVEALKSSVASRLEQCVHLEQ